MILFKYILVIVSKRVQVKLKLLCFILSILLTGWYPVYNDVACATLHNRVRLNKQFCGLYGSGKANFHRISWNKIVPDIR